MAYPQGFVSRSPAQKRRAIRIREEFAEMPDRNPKPLGPAVA
jgi:hypothetical protein